MTHPIRIEAKTVVYTGRAAQIINSMKTLQEKYPIDRPSSAATIPGKEQRPEGFIFNFLHSLGLEHGRCEIPVLEVRISEYAEELRLGYIAELDELYLKVYPNLNPMEKK